MFEGKFPEQLYQSYIIEGDKEILIPELISYLENHNILDKENPDLLVQKYDALTISDSPIIKEWHNNRSTDGKRVCIIGASFINREAEQSLLKILEEPGENTHFFIIVPNASLLLPTILSRTHTIHIENDTVIAEVKKSVNFIKSNPKDRIDIVAEIIKMHDKDEDSAGLRADATNLINNIEIQIHNQFLKDKNNKDLIFSLGELQKARKYMSTSGASVKMILEHIALVL